MDHSTLQHHQEIMEAESLESMLVSTKQSQSQGQKQQDQKKPRPAEGALKCPRCDSTNTKFCYYNNYSLTQPRYFCKSCRRYWTQGGTLRNVPVGGGCRKNRRAPTSSVSRRAPPDHHQFLATSCTPTSSSLSDFSPASYGNSNIALLGMNMNPGNSHFALLGNSLGFLDGAVLNPFGLGENAENGRGNSVNNVTSHDMGIHQQLDHQHNQAEIMSCNSSVTSSPTRAIKHEVGENRSSSSSSVFLGLPWQLSGGDHQGHNYMMMNNFGGGNQSDYVRESWTNGVLGSSWHNLLNSPLI